VAHKEALEALDVTLKDLRGHNNLMGGAVILLCGDFLVRLCQSSESQHRPMRSTHV
jgi:hypothetical protein